MSSDCGCDLPLALHSGPSGMHRAGGAALGWYLDEAVYAEPGPECACCAGSTAPMRYICAEHGTAVCHACFEREVTLSRCTCAERHAA